MDPREIDTSRRPFVLAWEPPRACAPTCKHRRADPHCRADAQPRRHPDGLTTAEGRARLEDARTFGEGQLVVLSGGDPLGANPLCSYVPDGYDGPLPERSIGERDVASAD